MVGNIFFFSVMLTPIMAGVLNGGWIVVGILFVVFWPIYFFYKKNKIANTAWIEKEALMGEETQAAPEPDKARGAA